MAYDTSSGQLVLFGGDAGEFSPNDTWEWNGSSWIELYPPTSPSSRNYASMAYDPATNQIVLFGGDNSGLLDDTWTWDGSTWTQRSPPASPPARADFSMAYDPALEEVVLFGGEGADGLLNDTWAWNGSTWSQLSPSTSPPARDDAAMAFDTATNQLVLMGGSGQANTYLNDVWNLDGSQWTQMSGLFAGLAGASMAYDATTGQFLLVDGTEYTSNGFYALGDTLIWNGTTWTETGDPSYSAGFAASDAPLAYDAGTGQLVLFGNGGTTWTWDGSGWNDMSSFAAPSPRFGAAMTYDPATGQVVLFGGQSSGLGYDGAIDPDAWTFDGSSWAHAPTGPPGRYDASMAYDPATNQVVLFGGYGAQGWCLGDTWTFDGSSWTEQSPANSPSARALASMAYDAATRQLILFGGVGSSPQNDTWAWNGSDWSELSPATSPPARDDASMAYDSATSQLVLFGGTSDGLDRVMSDTWSWDGSNWTEQSPDGSPSSPSPRLGASLAYDAATGELVLLGGIGTADTFLSDIWTWDGSSWTEQSPSVSPPGRSDGSMTYDASTGEVVLFGGDTDSCGYGSCALGDTWTFDGSVWSELSFAFAPPATSGSSIAYDSATGQLTYLADDSDSGILDGTWTFDGTAWTDHRMIPVPPQENAEATMVYDPSSGQLILFGGFANGYLNDTWDWNGTSWVQLSPPSSPSPRTEESMTYDAALGEIVLFGGFGELSDDSIGPLGDTWAWDGSTWTELSATGPPPRSMASMTFDAATAQVVLFGGNGTTSDLGDTWTLDGSTWTEQSPSSYPPNRYEASMAYDPTLGAAVLFGGRGVSSTPFDDTWSWDGSDWSQLSPATSPAAREGAAMTYDAALGQLVLIGGQNNTTTFDDFWSFGPYATAPSVSLSERQATGSRSKETPTSPAVAVRYGGESSAVFSVTLVGTSGHPAPTGTISVEDIVGSYPLRICTITTLASSGVDATGSCRAGAQAFRAGTRLRLAVTAVYAGSSSYESQSARLAGTFTVIKAKSTTRIKLSLTSLRFGEELGETVKVRVTPEYSGMPAGFVEVTAGAKQLCSVRLTSGGTGVCTLSESALGVGEYSVMASYRGSMDFLPSTSHAVKLVVRNVRSARLAS
ncbi:MAG TPA: kelch repeat-containing protein [Acidimicrobiales bacterium]|nr:kelch repeat-containing protein [Acidimicrobiales bacterium]